MPDELEFWRQWNLIYPLDDLHRIYKPAALIASVHGGKDAYSAALDFLSPDPKKSMKPRRLRPARVIRSKPA